MNKFYNDAIIGNKDFIASFSVKGELLRFCYPQIDGRQFVDFFRNGVKINDSNIIYLHDDINNVYEQEYVIDTNILETDITNTYFNLNIKQTDCALVNEDLMIKKYEIKNNNNIDLNISFIVNSKILAGNFENFGSKVIKNGVIQYNHNYSFSIFSNKELSGHKLNDVQNVIETAILQDKDYIGMSNEVAISYDIGQLKPNEQKEFILFIHVDNTPNVEEKLNKFCKLSIQNKILDTKNYWQEFVKNHKKIKLDLKDNFLTEVDKIYTRTILLYPLLFNYKTGGIAAALENDENREKSGSYSYCWTRDAIFIAKAFELLNMNDETEAFYNNFCKKTQSENGMWEQRFYTDTTLAPCWGYQVDETASIIYGIYNYYIHSKKINFLANNLKMCENGINFLFKYVENVLGIEEEDLVKKELHSKYNTDIEIHKHISYDLWEMNEGVHLYSICSIVSAFECMKKIYNILNDEEKSNRLKKEKRNLSIQKLTKYSESLKEYIKNNFIDKDKFFLKRNTKDSYMDISVIGSVYPFEVFDCNDKIVTNTVEKINMTLRTYTSGYLRFEGDSYMGGENPWVITTLWMAMYYIKFGNIDEAKKCFKFVVQTCCKHGFLSEQVNNDNKDFKWVIGLGWSHAMFVIVLKALLDGGSLQYGKS